MCYRIAGIDVHKRMLAVVVAHAATEGELRRVHLPASACPPDWRQRQRLQVFRSEQS
jgi:hypothetical protein